MGDDPLISDVDGSLIFKVEEHMSLPSLSSVTGLFLCNTEETWIFAAALFTGPVVTKLLALVSGYWVCLDLGCARRFCLCVNLSLGCKVKYQSLLALLASPVDEQALLWCGAG